MKPIVLAVIGLILSSCCRQAIPIVEQKDTTSIRTEYRNAPVMTPADSSLAQYLIECEKTSQGYVARIGQLLQQQSGSNLKPPQAVINNGVLTTTAYQPERKIYVTVPWFYSTTIKSKVYLRTTNILTGWQTFWIRCGYILAGVIAAGTLLLIGKYALKWPP